MAWLTYQRDGRQLKHDLVKDDNTIGRSQICDIRIEHETESSRLHCSIHRRDRDTFVLLDTASKNGTYHNGARIGHEEIELAHGDRIRVGHVIFTFHAPDASATALALDEIAKELDDGKEFGAILHEIVARKPSRPTPKTAP